ncbi:MAG: TetR/AcrR family transcriptional regulator [Pseudomonadota bacterium]
MSRQESKDLTRQRLREAALAEFERYGVAAASIDRITEAAGYSRGAFYANYESKFELALELSTENARQETVIMEGVIESTPVAHAMLEYMRSNFDRLAKEPVWWVLAIEVRMEAARNPEFRARYQAQDDLVASQLRQMLRSLCRAAGCGETVDIDYVAVVIQSFSQGLYLDASRPSLPSPGTLLVRLLVDLLGRPSSLMGVLE